MLSARGLTKRYGSVVALAEVTLTVAESTISVVVGPTGAGKSTLLRALTMVTPADTGEIRLDGTVFTFPASATGPTVPWPTVTIVFQELGLWPHLTVRDNILLPLRRLPTEDRRHRLDEVCELLGLGTTTRRFPHELSGGQRQLAAIARAIALRPRYLVLDEPAAALDVRNIQRLVEILAKLRLEGVSIVLSTHLLGIAGAIADQVLYLEAGALVETGDASILHSPRTAGLADFLELVMK